MKIQTNLNLDARRNHAAFTLMEVMIAMGIFFMAVFSILALVSSNLRNARFLQEPTVDTSMVLGDFSQTNIFMEGTYNGDFGDLYPGYKWTYNVTQEGTNGWFQIDLFLIHPNGKSEMDMQVHLWRGHSPEQGAFK